MNGASCVVEEDINSLGAGLLHGSSETRSFFIINGCIEPDLATPLKFVIVSGDSHRTTSGQFGDFADKLADRSRCS